MFDCRKLSNVLKEKNITTTDLYSKLNNNIGIENLKGIRKGNIKNPKMDLLLDIANITDTSVLDFFSNTDIEKKKIIRDYIIQENQIENNEIKKIIELFQFAPDDFRKDIISKLENIKKIVSN